jgi:hypothetical protein
MFCAKIHSNIGLTSAIASSFAARAWAKVVVKGTPKAVGEGMRTTDSFRLIPLTLQHGATQHAHLKILA